MVFYIKFTQNTLMDMTRMPLGILEIKFHESKIFFRRNRLNRLLRHKLHYKLKPAIIAAVHGPHNVSDIGHCTV